MGEGVANFDRAALEAALLRLGEIARSEGKLVEISIYGGSALILAFDARVATRDVDAVFDQDRSFVRRAAAQVAAELDLDPEWINDGVKGFLSARDDDAEAKTFFRDYPTEGGHGLRVFLASPQYLFAMKSLAMRIGGVGIDRDVEDIRLLGAHLGISDAEDAMALVGRYYPASRISPKTQFGLQEIFGLRKVVE